MSCQLKLNAYAEELEKKKKFSDSDLKNILENDNSKGSFYRDNPIGCRKLRTGLVQKLAAANSKDGKESNKMDFRALLYFADVQDHYGFSRVTYKDFCEDLKCSKPEFYRSLSRLKEFGIIEYERSSDVRDAFYLIKIIGNDFVDGKYGNYIKTGYKLFRKKKFTELTKSGMLFILFVIARNEKELTTFHSVRVNKYYFRKLCYGSTGVYRRTFNRGFQRVSENFSAAKVNGCYELHFEKDDFNVPDTEEYNYYRHMLRVFLREQMGDISWLGKENEEKLGSIIRATIGYEKKNLDDAKRSFNDGLALSGLRDKKAFEKKKELMNSFRVFVLKIRNIFVCNKTNNRKPSRKRIIKPKGAFLDNGALTLELKSAFSNAVGVIMGLHNMLDSIHKNMWDYDLVEAVVPMLRKLANGNSASSGLCFSLKPLKA